jgi:hypothetical protein
MRARLLAMSAVAGMAVAAFPAHAATVKPAPAPQVTDPAGDANFVNGQGFVGGAPSQATPQQQASADLLSVLFQSTFTTTTTTKKVTVVVKKKKVTKLVTTTTQTPSGFTVTMSLAAAPGPETEYRVTAVTPGCTALYFEYSTDALVQSGQVPDVPGVLRSPKSTQVRCAGTPAASFTVPAAVVKNSTITWTVPAAAIAVGTKLTTLGAETRVNPFALTAPQYDEATSAATFTVGK